ncbi:MFS transporter [Propionicimonas sp.]|uniref:MFS transporter n=1 Tax=Propionicimonas sp. TaxID=1955623 RepID=UPI001844AE93|nr:MFS transporter [Propionicimonas sp.]MBU3977315.1 MFS transporter [Actinomycetota bacterium]MBA3021240.1 MFS transporter [Propionicimonas sp.]MBU3985825.1 MFS transporter [Actinomycetota bacterium]MBU4008610.1 MFS transporter [Actinomycetota bacterium]MBU4066240.1 MFS transporter [Actinomycetota bacterium]
MKSTKEQRSWYWYDWANSAYITTTATVIIGPYLTSLANNAACPDLVDGQVCQNPVMLLGLFPVLPGALHPFLATLSTIISAVLLLFVGALVDRSAHPHRWLAGSAWLGATAGSMMFFLEGDNWELGAWLMIIAAFSFGASTVVYDSILVRISGPDDRDRVSSRGWAFGYVGGGLLLAANFLLMTFYDQLGLSYGMAIRLSLLSAGLWWGLFTIIPVLGLRKLPKEVPVEVSGHNPFSQLANTFAQMKHYPQTMLFLLAFLFYNDGIQTVIVSSSLYASKELGMATSQVMLTFLVTQFVAIAGALLFGLAAAKIGAKKTVLIGLVIWLGVVGVGFVLPVGVFGALVALGAAIGLVMGGTQALSRSMYSQLIPLGRESEYFSFYQAMERGTSWLGTLTFALVFQFSQSYRLALVALIVFFVIGGVLLSRVNMRQGITDAGNALPKVL